MRPLSVQKAVTLLLMALVCAALLFAGAPQAGAGGSSAPEGYVGPPSTAKCPVCGMFVYLYPDWIAALKLEDGHLLYFDGAKDFFKYIMNAEGDRDHELSGKEAVYVTEYYGLEVIDARAAYFVAGSDVLGPMGRELIPFASLDDALEFIEDHGGGPAFTFADVTEALVRSLDRRGKQ